MSEPSPPPEPIDAEIVASSPIPPVTNPEPDFDERGVPSLDHVRAKIEARHARSRGATELTDDTVESRTIEQQLTERDEAAKIKLAEIRRGLDR